jgi:nitrate reductase / nitrite oxidoreductase, alpha subunit
MSHLLDRLNFLKSVRKDTFAGGHGQTTIENRDWEDTYRRAGSTTRSCAPPTG